MSRTWRWLQAVGPLALYTATGLAPVALAASPQVGRPAPPLSGTTLAGDRFGMPAQLGKVVVVRFWATWCVPCREELPAIDAYYRRRHAEGLEIIAISVDTPADRPKVEAEAGRFAFPAAMAGAAEFKGYGRIWRMPMTFVVDRRGILRFDGGAGAPVQITEQWLEQNVSPLLAEHN